jgi:glycosyltransferase involved in cell wall biosynthesis
MTGMLVRPADAVAFAAAVRRLIIDRGRRAAFAEAAQRRARTEHDLSTAARRLATAIEMVWRAPPA